MPELNLLPRSRWLLLFVLLFAMCCGLGYPVLNRTNNRDIQALSALAAFAMNTYYGGAPGTVGRALFSIAGPLLSASVALLLFTAPAGRNIQFREEALGTVSTRS